MPWMRMGKETKFGYGFLLAGVGLPYLIDKLVGELAALIVAAVCTVAGIGLLILGHFHVEEGAEKTIGKPTAIVTAIIFIGAVLTLIWAIVNYWGTLQAKAGHEVYAEVTIPDYILIQPKAGEPLTVELLLLNSSKFDINFSIRWLIDIAYKNKPQSTEEELWQFMQRHLKQPSPAFSIQGSGGKITMPLTVEPLTPSGAQELLARQAQVYVMGTIVYEDSNGEHEREFCSYLQWPRTMFLPGLCHSHNGAVKPHDLQ
jgi:hypothetical protein